MLILIKKDFDGMVQGHCQSCRSQLADLHFLQKYMRVESNSVDDEKFLNLYIEVMQIFGVGISSAIRFNKSCSAASVKLCFNTNDIISSKLVTRLIFDSWYIGLFSTDVVNSIDACSLCSWDADTL